MGSAAPGRQDSSPTYTLSETVLIHMTLTLTLQISVSGGLICADIGSFQRHPKTAVSTFNSEVTVIFIFNMDHVD